MGTFSISEAARDEINRISLASGLSDPVVTLGDCAPVDLPSSLKSAALKGLTDEQLQEAQQLIDKQMRDSGEHGSITVTAHERREYRSADIFQVDGLSMAMTLEMRDALREYCLNYIEGEFVLVSATETVRNLRSVRSLARWFV